MMVIALVILVSVIVSSVSSQNVKQIFIDTTIDNEEAMLFNLFNGIEDGYYVDVGAYDPLYQSNTFNLYSMGWSGVNVEASLPRMQSFVHLRPTDTNLHLAVAGEQKMVTLFEGKDDSASTVSAKIKGSNPEAFKGSSQVHALPLAQICKRYFLTRPKFMSVDIEGLGFEAFNSNDWQNPKCSPEVIYLKARNITQQNSQVQQLLNKHGYIKVTELPLFNVTIGKQLFISKEKLDFYSKKYQRNKGQFQSKKNIHNLYNILHEIEQIFGLKIMPNQLTSGHINNSKQSTNQIYSAIESDVYLHIAKNGNLLDLLSLNKHSNLLSTKQNRPILVLNYNPHKSSILLPKNSYYKQLISTQNYYFQLITIQKADITQFQAYILDLSLQSRKIIIKKPRYYQNQVIFTEQPIQQQQYQIQKILLLISFASIIFLLLMTLIMLIKRLFQKSKNKNQNGKLNSKSPEIFSDVGSNTVVNESEECEEIQMQEIAEQSREGLQNPIN